MKQQKQPSSQTALAQAKSLSQLRLVILYGSQMGQSKHFAALLTRELHRRLTGLQSLHSEPVELSEANSAHQWPTPEDVPDILIFCVSTYGSGEPPDGIRDWFEWLMSLPANFLIGKRFTVLSLGDSRYPKFCRTGRILNARLEELGASRLLSKQFPTEVDAAVHNGDDLFDTWRIQVLQALGECGWNGLGHHFIESNPSPEDWSEPPAYTLRIFTGEDAEIARDEQPLVSAAPMQKPSFRQPFFAKLIQRKHWTTSEEGSQGEFNDEPTTLSFAFDCSGSPALQYEAGDHVALIPYNPEVLIDETLSILTPLPRELGENLNNPFELRGALNRNVLPACTDLRNVLKWHINLSGCPCKSTLRCLWQYCSDEGDKKRLWELCAPTPEAEAHYAEYLCKTPLMTTTGFLRSIAPSCRVPLEHFLELMPRIQPRYYSVASDSMESPSVLRITVSLVEGGLCSKVLQNAPLGTDLPLFVRHSNFKLPNKLESPLVMIAAGTGIAPFLGFISRLRSRQQAEGQNQSSPKPLKLPTWLFVGCRRHLIHSDELETALQNGTLAHLLVSFSRIPSVVKENGGPYVQHRMAQFSSDLWRLLSNKESHFYICGDASRLAVDVEATLCDIIRQEGKKSLHEAAIFLEEMIEESRLQKDVWTV